MTIETKFKPNDFVFFMHNNAVQQAQILRLEIYVNDGRTSVICKLKDYTSNYDHTVNEDKCFATKPELLNSL